MYSRQGDKTPIIASWPQEDHSCDKGAMGGVAEGAKGRMTLTWSSSLDSWQELKLELQNEVDAIFASSGEIVVVASDSESDSVLTLESRTGSLKITFCPDRNAVRWDTPDEYGFEKIPEETASLARSLVQRLRR